MRESKFIVWYEILFNNFNYFEINEGALPPKRWLKRNYFQLITVLVVCCIRRTLRPKVCVRFTCLSTPNACSKLRHRFESSAKMLHTNNTKTLHHHHKYIWCDDDDRRNMTVQFRQTAALITFFYLVWYPICFCFDFQFTNCSDCKICVGSIDFDDARI